MANSLQLWKSCGFLTENVFCESFSQPLYLIKSCNTFFTGKYEERVVKDEFSYTIFFCYTKKGNNF